MTTDNTRSSALGGYATSGGRPVSGPRKSVLERRVADGTHTTDAHTLARSFLAYLEELAGRDR